MRSVFVVVERVARQHGFELATRRSAADRGTRDADSDPTLGVRSSFGARPAVRGYLRSRKTSSVTGELAVAVADQEPRSDVLVGELHQQVPRLLGHPGTAGFAVIPARRTRRVANSMKKST